MTYTPWKGTWWTKVHLDLFTIFVNLMWALAKLLHHTVDNLSGNAWWTYQELWFGFSSLTFIECSKKENYANDQCFWGQYVLDYDVENLILCWINHMWEHIYIFVVGSLTFVHVMLVTLQYSLDFPFIYVNINVLPMLIRNTHFCSCQYYFNINHAYGWFALHAFDFPIILTCSTYWNLTTT